MSEIQHNKPTPPSNRSKCRQQQWLRPRSPNRRIPIFRPARQHLHAHRRPSPDLSSQPRYKPESGLKQRFFAKRRRRAETSTATVTVSAARPDFGKAESTAYTTTDCAPPSSAESCSTMSMPTVSWTTAEVGIRHRQPARLEQRRCRVRNDNRFAPCPARQPDHRYLQLPGLSATPDHGTQSDHLGQSSQSPVRSRLRV